MNVDQLQALKEFCYANELSVGKRTKELIDLRLDGASYKTVQDIMNLEAGNARNLIRQLETRANTRGFNRNAVHQTPVEDGYMIKGKSRLIHHGPLGPETRLEWVKTDIDKERQSELYKAFIEGLCKDITPIKPRTMRKSGKYDKSTMPAICIGDAHIGLRAFGLETKHADFDTKIATNQLKEAFHYLTDIAQPAEESLFINVGDLIHANTQHGQTYSGTPQDVDSRHQMVMRSAAECMAYGIDLQLKKHKRVTVIMARGNHDTDAAGAIQLMLEFYYRNEPRVRVLPTYGFYHFVEWGKNLIGVHHGDKQKPESLVSSMARDMPEAWGRTAFRIFLTGHYHKDAVKTLPGMTHKVCAALPPPDSWHASHGYAGDGEMEMLTFRREGGKPHSAVFHVPQPRVEPDVRLG